jgi:hypoxia up-regulated 1
LESFVIDVQQKIELDEYKVSIHPEEADKIKKSCNDVSEWLYEEGFEATAEIYEEKLNDLQKLTHDLYERVFEHIERPEALKGLVAMINVGKASLKNIQGLQASSEIFTAVEIETLEKVINETEVF